MLVSLSVLTLVGLVALHAAPYLSDVIGVLLVGAVVIYYAIYFKQYRNLGDAFNQHRQYYFEVYSVWGIIFFNSLFLFVFAFIGAILSSEFPKLGFGGASFYELLIFISQAVVDGATFGLLGSYGINISDVHMQGFFASTYVYVA